MSIEYILDLACPVKEIFLIESPVPRVKNKRQGRCFWRWRESAATV